MSTRIIVITGFAITSAALVAAASCSSSTSPSSIHYTASLSAANERQTNPDGTPKTINSTATGTATLTLTGNDTLTYTVTVANLTAAATASHIHVGTAAVSGPVVNGFVVNAGVTSGVVTSGTIILSNLVAASGQISGDSLRVLLDNGNAYVNVHTSTYPAGEIRGQIVRQ